MHVFYLASANSTLPATLTWSRINFFKVLKISFNSALTQVKSEASRALAEVGSPWQRPAQAHHTLRELARAALLSEKLFEVSKLCLIFFYGKADL